ncbi:MAG: hypothetical protein KA362_18510 [Chloroflexi bacterium]|nr:hypothetical protein [Chloroflexota bacterium]MBP6806111.1 hypothetical protein [Chloroflexota bacterium]
MGKAYVAQKKKSLGDTAVDGLVAGLPAGVGMAVVLALVGFVSGRSPLVTLGYFDPAQNGRWLTGLLAHLAVAAIYGVVFALLLAAMGRIRPSVSRLVALWGMVYGLVLLAVAYGVWFTAVPSPLAQIAAWQMALAHGVYGLGLGLGLRKNQ